ncbi:NPSR1 (predicted) [Pycnogonum litorale]
MIVIGNSAVLLALALSKRRRSRMTFFIMHLAIADLSVGLISVLVDVIWKTTIRFDGGTVVCKLVKFFQVLVTFSSTYVLVALSIDRFDAIIHPMNFSGSWKRAKVLVIVAWLLSAVFSTPVLFFYRVAVIDGLPQCWMNFSPTEWQVYVMLIAISLFFIPTLIISACYGAIMHTIWSKSKNMSANRNLKLSITNKRKSNAQTNRDGEKYSKRSSSRGIIPKAKIKTVKMTCTIVLMFVICWCPYFVYSILNVFQLIDSNSRVHNAVATFMHSLAPLNSAANPLIYCLFSTRICRNLRKIVYLNWLADKLCPCCKSSTYGTTSQTSATNRSCYSTTVSETTRATCNRRAGKSNPHRPMQTEIINGNVVCRLASDMSATADTDGKMALTAV